MAGCQKWWLCLANISFFVCGIIYAVAGDDPNRFVYTEPFLGLNLPDCPDWRCDGRCDSVLTMSSALQFGCQCDSKCLIYGDCCFDFFFGCLRLPDDEILELMQKNRVDAFRSAFIGSPSAEEDQSLQDSIQYERCHRPAHPSNHGQGVYLIAVCPDFFDGNKTKELCEESSDNILNQLPVDLQESHGTSYKNLHCAQCHGFDNDDIIFWTTNLACKEDVDLSTLSSETLTELVANGKCQVEYLPSAANAHQQRSCWPGSVNASVCPEDGGFQPNKIQPSFKGAQHWYSMTVEIRNGTIFRNPHHVDACGESLGVLNCVSVEEPNSNTETFESGVMGSIVIHQHNNALVPVIKTTDSSFLLNEPRCSDGKIYDYFQQTCVPLVCQTGWYGHHGQCLPLEVSPIPADYSSIDEDQIVSVVHLTFATKEFLFECEDIWDLIPVMRVLNIFEDGPGEFVRKSCEITTVRKKERGRFSGLAWPGRGGNLTSNSTDGELPSTIKVRRKQRNISRRQRVKKDISMKTMADSSPVVRDAHTYPPKNDAISPELREKLINMVGIVPTAKQDDVEKDDKIRHKELPITGLQGKHFINLKIEISNFEVDRLEEVLFMLKVELKENFKHSEPDLVKLEEVEILNFNTTPSCKYSDETRTNMKLYQRGKILYAYDDDSKEQIPLSDVYFRVYVNSNYSQVSVSTAIRLCHLPTTGAPKLECPLSYTLYDKGDYDVKNNTLYVNSIKRAYEWGTFEIRGRSAYVCAAPNVTNDTSTQTVHRGFFTMPYAQYVVVMVCCCVSIACLLTTFITYVCFAQLRDISGIILMCLTSSLMVAQLLFAGGLDQTDIQELCITIAIFLHFIWLSVFAWMNVLTYDIAHKLRNATEDTAEKNAKAFKEYCIFAWGVPFLLVGICAALDFAKGSGLEMEYAHDSCWIGSVMSSVFGFAIPAALLVLGGLVLSACTIYALYGVTKVAQLSDKQKKSLRLLIIYSFLTMIMALSWGFAYLGALTDYEEMWYVFAGLNALQGIFTVGCFVVKSRVVRLYKTRFGGERKSDYPPEEFV